MCDAGTTNLLHPFMRRPNMSPLDTRRSIMRYACLLLVSLTLMLPVTAAAEEPLVRFDGGIGATPAAIAAGVLVINTTRGVPPGGRPWVIESLRAEVKIDGRVSVEGR